jgi:hypothetical protein
MSSSSSIAGTRHPVAGRRRHLLVGALVLLIAFTVALVSSGAAYAEQLVRVSSLSRLDCRFVGPGTEGQIFSIDEVIDVVGDAESTTQLRWASPADFSASVTHNRHYVLNDNGITLDFDHGVTVGAPLPPAGWQSWAHTTGFLYFTVSQPALIEVRYKLTNPVNSATKHCFLEFGLWTADAAFTRQTELLDLADGAATTADWVVRTVALVPGRYYVFDTAAQGGFGYTDGAAAGEHQVAFSMSVSKTTAEGMIRALMQRIFTASDLGSQIAFKTQQSILTSLNDALRAVRAGRLQYADSALAGLSAKIATYRKVITPAAVSAIQTGIDDIRAAVQWQAGVTNP